ncbi:hypothetical protein niasHS_017186 [Heterodera schachtii]|uniref:Uncharacterized protein n=2 Tax=Heterodera TaxID=34509 RepID=A0ABD2HSL5_HETSC
MSSPIDAILGKENADPEAGAKALKAKGSNKPKVPPANIAEIQAELGKAKEEILSAVSTYISEAMSTVNRGMEGFTTAISQMANVLDASRAREEMEQMSLDDPELEDVSIEAGETGKEPEKPTDGENDPGETPQGHQGPKGIPLAQEHSVRERGRGTGHGRAFIRGRGGHCRGTATGAAAHARHYFNIRQGHRAHHQHYNHRHSAAGPSGHCRCHDCQPPNHHVGRRFRPYAPR